MREHYMEVYNKCAAVLLPLNYYSFFEQWADGQYNASLGTAELIVRTVEQVGTPDDKIYDIRKEIIKRTEEIMYYLDKYTLFEYMLARIEDKYNKDTENPDIQTEINKLIEDVSRLKDRSLVQTNITGIMSQLPVRMTKQKFLDVVAENIKFYTGLPKKGADEFYYNTLSYAGIKKEALTEEYYPELKGLAEKLEKLDFTGLSESEYRNILAEYNKAEEQIRTTIDCYEELIKIINNLIILKKTEGFVSEEAEEVNVAVKGMLEKVTEAIINNDSEAISEDITDCFEKLEGRIEKYTLEKDRLEGKHYKEDEQKEVMILSALLSSSVFAEIDDIGEEQGIVNVPGEVADKDYIGKLTERFREKFLSAVEGEARLLTRSRMAAVLGQVAPLFDNINDFKAYMESTLGACRDDAERYGSLRQIHRLLD